MLLIPTKEQLRLQALSLIESLSLSIDVEDMEERLIKSMSYTDRKQWNNAVENQKNRFTITWDIADVREAPFGKALSDSDLRDVLTTVKSNYAAINGVSYHTVALAVEEKLQEKTFTLDDGRIIRYCQDNYEWIDSDGNEYDIDYNHNKEGQEYLSFFIAQNEYLNELSLGWKIN